MREIRAAIGLFLLVVCACGGSSSGLQPQDPAKLLTQAGAATGALHSVSATLKFSKGTLSFRGYALVSAVASVRLPDTSDTAYTVRSGDTQIELEVVITDGKVFLRIPFTGLTQLTGQDAADIPDLAKLFDPDHGLPAVIPAGASPKYIGASTAGGVESHEVGATYTPVQIQGMLSQLASSGNVDAQIWIDPSDHLIRKAVLSGPFGDNGIASSVEVDLSDFNHAVTIPTPVLPTPSG
jgi:hypothetical protein